MPSTPPAAGPAFRLLAELVTVPADARVDAIAALLPDARRQPCRTLVRRGTNLIVGSDRPRLVIGAHHDLDPGTDQGATDNTAAVAVLVALAQELQASGFPDDLALCFWDFEEPGNGGFADGSYAYARCLREAGVVPDLVIVCDVFGLGVPWVSRRSDVRAAMELRQAVRQATDARPDAVVLRDLSTPGSDDVGFARAGLPSVLLTTLPPSGDRSGWGVMHTLDDTIDMVDPASLEAAAAVLRAAVDRLVRQELTPAPALGPWVPPADRVWRGLGGGASVAGASRPSRRRAGVPDAAQGMLDLGEPPAPRPPRRRR